MQHDEVDGILAAWRRERPDVDASPLEVLSRVSRLAHRAAVVRRKVFSGHDLDAWEFDVLAALRRAGVPYQLSPGQLATETLVTSGTMTNRLDRLAAKGLITRLPSPVDRRGVTVQLADEGRERVDAAFSSLVAAEHDLLADLPPADRAVLAATLRRLLLALGG